MRAGTPAERERHATAGLAQPDAQEPDTKALLLRQLYMAHLERDECAEALEVAEEMVELSELADVARQDAARAALGLGEWEVAVDHLRIAARICPPDRRSFHHATLGALLRFEGRYEQAVESFSRAVRWATRDRDLHRAQLVLCEVAAGREASIPLRDLREQLEETKNPKVYDLLILGELCWLMGDNEASLGYLGSFLDRFGDAPRAKTLALQGEIAHARALVSKQSA